MKRFLSILFLLCAAISVYADGEVVEIWTKSQLAGIRDDVNSGTDNYSGKTVRLMADLDVGSGWTPIGTADDDAHSFQGTFDGQGYTVKISTTASSTVLGLFGYFRGTVQHLKVKGSVVNTETATTSSTAGIVAYNRGTISQCANMASIVGTTAGGIAGENHGTLTNCYNRGYLGATGGYAGTYYMDGIAGIFDGAEMSSVYASCSIEDVSSTGGVTANSQSGTLSKCFYDVKLDGMSEMSGSTSLVGDALKEQFDHSIWVFAAGELPELACFTNKIVRLSDNHDNSSILTLSDGMTCNVELSGRTLYKDGKWNTLCLPFDLTLSGSVLDGGDVTAKVLDSSGTSLDGEGLLTLSFTDAPSTIPAGTPFIIKWNPGEHLQNVMFSNVTVTNAAPAPVSFCNASGDDGQFVGTYSPFSIIDANIDKIVMLSGDNMLGYSQNPRTLRSCRVHFMIPTTAAGIRSMVAFDIDFDAVTAIDGLTVNSQPPIAGPNDWYTLAGVKLCGEPAEKGVYIVNGRKVVIK